MISQLVSPTSDMEGPLGPEKVQFYSLLTEGWNPEFLEIWGEKKNSYYPWNLDVPFNFLLINQFDWSEENQSHNRLNTV